MNTEKIKTLEKLLEAMESVENARLRKDLSWEEKAVLEKTAVELRNIERSIIRVKTNELISTLNRDAIQLEELIEKMKNSSEKLDNVVQTIEKAVSVVNVFIKIISKAIAAGLS